MAAQPIYQFYTELIGYEPKMWRRFQMTGNHSVARLGYNLMTMYEMMVSHLFFLEQVRENAQKDPQMLRTAHYQGHSLHEPIMEYWVPALASELELYDPMENLPVYIEDAVRAKVQSCFHEPGDLAVFHYDLGDGWMVNVVLEAIFRDEELSGHALPRVIEGEGYGIIEDCGGIGGLTDLARAFKFRFGHDYEELRTWLGVDELDLDTFDRADVNRRLKRLPGLYAKVCETRYRLTDAELNYLERAYLRKERR